MPLKLRARDIPVPTGGCLENVPGEDINDKTIKFPNLPPTVWTLAPPPPPQVNNQTMNNLLQPPPPPPPPQQLWGGGN